MPKRRLRLSSKFVEHCSKPGRYVDGNGLLLVVKATGGRSWIFRYQRNGRRREVGLGSARLITLKEARHKAEDLQRMLENGKDPYTELHRDPNPTVVTFQDAVEQYIEAHRAGWRNSKHAAQWSSTIATYARPVIGDLPVSEIGTPHVLSVLEPIWRGKTETASRLRGRIEAVLDWCRARGYRTGDNPARWRGHLNKLLPAPSKVASVRHHPALAWQQLPAFMAELVEMEGVAARALEFAILTAARSGEVRCATWHEIDMERGIWTLSAERMKGGREHRVPLPARAVEILRAMKAHGGSGEDHILVFPGARRGRPLSDMALSAVIRRMNEKRAAKRMPLWTGEKGRHVVPHGFRATFRTWAGEATAYPRELVEQALAHVIGDRTERAYARGDMFARRRRLMEDWARFAGGEHVEAATEPPAAAVRA